MFQAKPRHPISKGAKTGQKPRVDERPTRYGAPPSNGNTPRSRAAARNRRSNPPPFYFGFVRTTKSSRRFLLQAASLWRGSIGRSLP